jgi:ankyrin repeat protein
MKKILLFIYILVHAYSYAGPKRIPFDFESIVAAIFNDDQEIVCGQLDQLMFEYAKWSNKLKDSTLRDKMLKEHAVPQIEHEKLKKDEQFNLIMIAALKGKAKILESIIKIIPEKTLPEYLNKQNNNGRTALMLAGLSGNNETIQYLLSQKPDVGRVDFNGRKFYRYFPPHLLVNAIVANDQNAIDLYLPQPGYPKKCNRLTINQQINKEFERPEDERVTPLMAIAAKIPESQTEHDKIYFIKLAQLLISRVDIKRENNYKRTALMYAIAANNNPITELLMAKEKELLEPQSEEIPPEHRPVVKNESESSTFTIHSSDES